MSKTTTPDLAYLADEARDLNWSVDEYGTVVTPDGRTVTVNGFASIMAYSEAQIAARRRTALIVEVLKAFPALLDAYAEQGRKLEGLVETLQRIAAATPNSTNSDCADEAFSWVRAVANTALADPALKPIADQAATIAALKAEVDRLKSEVNRSWRSHHPRRGLTMNLSELILAVGDENVKCQNLDQCASDIDYSAKRGTRITFGTDVSVNLYGTELLGLVLWFDRDAVKAAIAKQAEA